MRLVGLWLTALVLWFCGFLGLIHIIRILTGPIIIDGNGIKLWRFGKVIAWQSISAMGTEQQKIFARAFFLKAPVLRFTLYVKRAGEKLEPVHLPSYLFLLPEFRSLIWHVSSRVFGFVPNGLQFLVLPLSETGAVKKLYLRIAKMRLLLSAIIVISLVSFLARKTFVNSEYNLGRKSFASSDYLSAKKHFRASAATDPTFAMAWDQLARCEYNLGNIDQAERDWLKALLVKPDLVEAKLGLSCVYIAKHQNPEAIRLLTQCTRLAPHNPQSYIYLTQLFLQDGKKQEAIDTLSTATHLSNQDANSLSACAQLSHQLGLDEQARSLAQKVLSMDPKNNLAKIVLTQIHIKQESDSVEEKK